MLKLVAAAIVLICFVLGVMAASLPNARQPIFAAFLFGYGATVLILIGLSFTRLGDVALKWFLIVTIGLVVIAYALPQSFWRVVGLKDGAANTDVDHG
jgi:Na+/H+ antiporter NhaB